MERTSEVLPTRGIIHDIGRAMTHKNHTEKACDRYIKAYKMVEMLSKTMSCEDIAQILGMGKSLVEEYTRILNED